MQELNRAPLTRDIAQSILFSSAVRSHLKRSWCETELSSLVEISGRGSVV